MSTTARQSSVANQTPLQASPSSPPARTSSESHHPSVRILRDPAEVAEAKDRAAEWERRRLAVKLEERSLRWARHSKNAMP